MKRIACVLIAVMALAISLGGLIATPAYAWHDGSVCIGYFDDGMGGATPVQIDVHSEAECAGSGADYGYTWTPAGSPPTTTTTTTTPPSTTSTIPVAIPRGSCSRSDAGFCVDAVNRGLEMDVSSCNTANNGDYCSPVFTESGGQYGSPNFSHSTAGGSGLIYNYRSTVNEWRLKRVGATVIPVSSRWYLLANDNSTTLAPHTSTGNLCGMRADGSYMAFDIAIPPGGGINVGTNLAYIFRPQRNPGGVNGTDPSPWPVNHPSGWTGFYSQGDAESFCAPDDPTVLTKTPVLTPAIDCYKEFTSTGVKIRAIVGNVSPGANDTVSIELGGNDTFASQLYPDGQKGDLTREFSLPLGPKPTDGWRGTCTVTRQVHQATHRGSSGWMNGAHIIKDVPPGDIKKNPRNADWQNCGTSPGANGGLVYNDCSPPQRSFEVPLTPPGPVVPRILPPGEPMPIYTVPPIVPPPVLTPLTPIGANVPTIVGIPAAGYTGWNLGGGILGLGSRAGLWTGDDEWFCEYNPGYRLARGAYCDKILADRPYLRNEIYLEDRFHHAITGVSTYDWVTAVAQAQVLVDPSNEEVGNRTTTAVELPQPQPDPNEVTQTGVATDPDTGTKRATAQTGQPDPTNPNPTGPTIADPRPAPTPVAPPPSTPGSGDCSLSLWDLLNPFNIASTMACFLKLLFIPDNGWSDLTTLWGDLTSRVPFSYLKQAVLFIPSLVTDIADSTSNASCANLLPHGLNDLPARGGHTATVKDLMGCPNNADSALHPVATPLAFVRNGVFLIFVLSMAFAVYHLIVWAIT